MPPIFKKVIVMTSFRFKVFEHFGRKFQEQTSWYNRCEIHYISIFKHWLYIWIIWRSFEKYWYLGPTPRDSDFCGVCPKHRYFCKRSLQVDSTHIKKWESLHYMYPMGWERGANYSLSAERNSIKVSKIQK